MTQYPPPYGPGSGGYPQQGQYPAPGQYPPRGGYPVPSGYPAQGGYPAPGVYGPPGPGAYGPPGPNRKSPVMIIVIVLSAVVALVAVGGILMALTGGGGTEPRVAVTPGQPSAPPSGPPDEPSGGPTTDPSPSRTPSAGPSPAGGPSPTRPTTAPAGNAVEVGLGISLTPAGGWSVKKTGKGAAQLSDGNSIFLGQAIEVAAGTNPGQLCTAWHKQVAEGGANGKFTDAKALGLGSKAKGATCQAELTLSSGQGTTTIDLFSLVSVRQSDGVTVIGTTYFKPGAYDDQLSKDFAAMTGSMVQSQTS